MSSPSQSKPQRGRQGQLESENLKAKPACPILPRPAGFIIAITACGEREADPAPAKGAMQSDTHRASQFYEAFQGLCLGVDDEEYLTCQRQLSDAFRTPSNAAFVMEQLALILCSAPSAHEEAQRGKLASLRPQTHSVLPKDLTLLRCSVQMTRLSPSILPF
jgi:hypothetical protein